MESLLRDIRFGLKLLLKEKTFSAAVLLTLAVCIGVNVAIYSVIHTVLLQPLPYAHPGRLVTIYNSYPGAGVPRAGEGSTDYFMQRGHIAALQDEAEYQGWGATVGDAGATARVQGMRVTASFFPLLGVRPLLGRAFTEDEMTPGNQYEVMLSWGYWQEHFAGERDVVGKDLRIDGRPYQVVGVLPRRFEVVGSPNVRLFAPIPYTQFDRSIQNWVNNSYAMIGRLRPGATIGQATAQIAALNASLIERWPVAGGRQILENAGFRTVVVNLHDDLVRDVRPILYMLWVGVGFVLLIGCVNIANLMLARSQVRMTELATRLALGAERTRLARQMLTESVVMGLLGGGLGIGIGALGLKLLDTVGVNALPRWSDVSIDASVLLFALVVTVGASALFGVVPIVHVVRSDLNAVFRAEGRSGTASHRSALVRRFLVATEVAVAFVLLIGAGLMFMSLRAALGVNPGFDPRGVLTANVALSGERYGKGDARRQFTEALLSAVRAMPGVEAAGVTDHLPLTGNGSSSVIFPEGFTPRPGESILAPFRSEAGPGYFKAMGIPLVAGRTFTQADGPNQQPVIIIDQWLAHRYWPKGNALGQQMVWGVAPGDSVPPDQVATIIGIVKDVKQNSLTERASEHVGAYYFTYEQQPPSNMTLVVRTATPPARLTPALRAALKKIDPDIPLFGVKTMEERVSESLASRRLPLALLAVFAGVALFLAVVGIYGALAYTVTQRTREIGIRVALGSTPGGIFKVVVGEGMRVAGIGLAVGLVAALLLTRFMRSLLFHVSPTDPWVLIVVLIVLALVALAACAIPARRATVVDAVTALTGQ